jgi:hydrogenase maturation protein HypF
VAALIGLRQEINYEAQAAIELEAIVDPDEEGSYKLAVAENGIIDPAPAILAILEDMQADFELSRIAARFHNGLADMAVDVCRQARRTHGAEAVVLSGGVWQNRRLFERVGVDLVRSDFKVITHERVPANDGGLALGQAAIAGARASAGLVPNLGR